MSRCTTLAAISGSIAGLAGAATMPVDMTGLYNANGSSLWGSTSGYQQWGSGVSSLTGNQVLGGVNFSLAEAFDGRNTYWDSRLAPRDPNTGEAVLDIPVNRFGVDKVHTLLNTGWGAVDQTYTTIEFFGTNNAHAAVDLYNGTHIRNWINRSDGGQFSVNFTSPDTQNVWTGNHVTSALNPGELRWVDMQTFDLPSAFDNQTLLSIRITERGGANVSTALINGASVSLFDNPVIPLPQTAPMALAGLALLASRRRRSHAR